MKQQFKSKKKPITNVFLLLLLSIALFSCTQEAGRGNASEAVAAKIKVLVDTLEQQGHLTALEDYSAKKAKYYVNGIALPKQLIIDSCKKKFDIQLVQLGCAPGRYELGYNRVMDSIAMQQQGITIQSLLSFFGKS